MIRIGERLVGLLIIMVVAPAFTIGLLRTLPDMKHYLRSVFM